LAVRQVGRGNDGVDRSVRRFHRRDGIVENILVGLFVGNVGLGDIGNLVATMGASRGCAVGQQQLPDMEANFFLGPVNGVANAIGHIHFAGFGDAHQPGMIEIEMGIMAANHSVLRCRFAEILSTLQSAGTTSKGRHRNSRRDFSGLGGLRRHGGEVFVGVAVKPGGLGQLRSVARRVRRRTQVRTQPASASKHKADDDCEQEPLHA